MDNKTEKLFLELVEICAKLRGKKGCMWDKKQTHKTLAPCLTEEAAEVVEAIEKNDAPNLKEELGDLLYQIVFHAQIAEEEDNFTIDDVLNDIIEKLIRRHPHVFGDAEVSSVEEILENWEKIKKKEKE